MKKILIIILIAATIINVAFFCINTKYMHQVDDMYELISKKEIVIDKQDSLLSIREKNLVAIEKNLDMRAEKLENHRQLLLRQTERFDEAQKKLLHGLQNLQTKR